MVLSSALWVGLPLPQVAAELTLRDRIVAVVDEDPIYLSDIERTLSLRLFTEIGDETPRQRRRRVLDWLIEVRLRQHRVDRYRLSPLPPERVERFFEQLRSGFDSPESFALAVEEGGLDEQAVRQILLGLLRVEQYIDERLLPRIFVDLDDIRAYYDGELTAELAQRGLEPEPIEEVRERIRDLLRDKRLNAEIDDWTEELRQAADIEDFFDRRLGDDLPPVLRRLESPR